MQSHALDYEIIGDDLQLVEVELDPNEVVIAEAGAMTYMEDGIAFESKLGDGTEPRAGFFEKLFGAGKRMVAGESLFLTHFRNGGSGKQRVAFAAPFPGKILALDLAQLGGELLCQREGFLAAAYGTKLSLAFTKRLRAGFFGGEGFILQRLQGDGMAFVHAGGTVIRKELRNSRLRIDTGCVVAFTPGIDFDIERAGNLRSMLFGGEGVFLATLQGTGSVWIQSMPFSRLADRVLANAPTAGGSRTDESSLLIDGLGSLIDRD